MQTIDLSLIQRWTMLGKHRVPAAIRTICPYCEEKVIFSLEAHTEDPKRLTIAAHALCPGCQRRTRFWAIRDNDDVAVCMFPVAKGRYPYPDLTDDIPEILKSAFFSTIDSFNSRNYAATAVTGRRTLEGIFKYLLPAEKRNHSLVKLIEIASQTDLAAPLTALSHAIRDGGNLGAHFDLERQPDEAVARQMTELLDYLISYLYVLPKKIEALETALSRGSSGELQIKAVKEKI